MKCNLVKYLVLAFGLFLGVWDARADIAVSGPKGADALVFIPGLSSDGALWQPWVDTYQDRYRVFVFTAPGFAGTSPRTDVSPFLEQSVTEIVAALKAEQAHGATIVGHSIGGLLALMLAEKEPALANKLLIVDSVPYLAGLFMPQLTPEQAATQAHVLGTQMAAMPEAAFRQQQQAGLGTLSKTADFMTTLQQWSAQSDQKTVAAAFAQVLATDFRPHLADIQAKTLVLAAYDRAMPFPRERLEALYRQQYAGLAGADIQLVDESFHFIMIDQKAAFSRVLDQFLSEEK